MTPTFVLIVCLSAMGTLALTPFELMDDYVAAFERDLNLLKTGSIYVDVPPVGYLSRGQNDTQETSVEEYDFIVVGSGAAGSALASRLSEIPEWKVLLLEAGTAEDAITKVPAMHEYLRTTSYNWQYKTVQQNTSCLGTENQECFIGTGKALGGDTVTNDMLYTRGHPKDYDTWADSGLTGWCWQSVFPYFKKIEDAYVRDLDRNQHHYGGPIHLENFQDSTPLAFHMLNAVEELGLKKIDYNGKERLGFGLPQVITKDGKRNSAASAYLANVNKRENLVIKPKSHAVKVMVSDHTKETKGVKYYHEGQLFVAKAAKEVILSAGAVNTVKLLLLSGIGPQHDLEALNIPLVSDLKVGQNLKDHVSFIGLNFLLNNTENRRIYYDIYCQNDKIEYLKNGLGPFTTTGLDLVGFIQTEASKSKVQYPDIQLLFTNNIYNKGYEHLKHLNIRKDIYDSIWAPLEGEEGFTIEVVLLHPKSTGYVKLHEKEPSLYPDINPNSLSDPDDEDVETILSGIHQVMKLINAEVLNEFGIYVNHHRVPACDQGHLDDDYWRCAIRHLSVNSRHLSGTAKMGPKDDEEAVVDEDLRVRGVHNLRVADSSVIPVSISGNLMAANLMIGEQAADKIKKDWSKEKCQC